VNDRFDLASVADDALILQQAAHFLLVKVRYAVKIEVGEGLPKVLAFGQDGSPAQAGLEAFQADLLKQTDIVFDRKAPLVVVIGLELRRSSTPTAAWLAIGPDHCLVRVHDTS
jgi:hypothetical protein